MSKAIRLQSPDVASAAFRSKDEHPDRNSINRYVLKLARSWAALVSRYLARRAVRQLRALDVRQLRGLDDRMLKDIGIDRSEIESVVRHGRRRRR